MVGSRVRASRVRRMVTLLVMAAIASTLSGVAPAAGGGKPMPAAVRSAAAGDRPPYLADLADPGVTTLTSDLGISIREAQQRMGWQEPAIALAGELERALGERYGDLWFDPRTGRVKGLTVWRLPDKNAVELDLPRGQRLTTAQQATVAAARRRLGSKLTFGTWAGRMHDLACAWSGGEFDCDPPLRGGVMLYIRSGTSYIPQCTVGFNAKSTVDGKWYVMTAGHCGPPGRTFYVYQRRTLQWHVLGHMHNCVWGEPTSGCVYSGDDDEGIITVDNVPGWNPKPWVYVHAWTGANDRTTENPGYPIYGTGGSRQGMRVCVSGAISGTSCGHVERLGGGSLAQVNLCTTHGDSGAPIFSGQKAYGLLKGTNNPDDPCEDRLYQGITEATQRLHVAVALALP